MVGQRGSSAVHGLGHGHMGLLGLGLQYFHLARKCRVLGRASAEYGHGSAALPIAYIGKAVQCLTRGGRRVHVGEAEGREGGVGMKPGSPGSSRPAHAI